jgi:hypothetical protein
MGYFIENGNTVNRFHHQDAEDYELFNNRRRECTCFRIVDKSDITEKFY